MEDKTLITPPTQAEIKDAIAGTEWKSLGKMMGMDVQTKTSTFGGARWVVCKARQVPSAARLLDVAVKVSADEKAPCLAILEGPSESEREMEADAAYLAAYQGIAWRAFNVAFVLNQGGSAFAPAAVAPSPAALGTFEKIAGELEAALKVHATLPAGGFWMVPEDSREAEGMVRLTFHQLLREKGYKRGVEANGDPAFLKKSYQGFWRGAEADGVWSNPSAPLQHLALESKLTEDAGWPLCQAVDHLAHVIKDGKAGGVLYVRVHRKPVKHPRKGEPSDGMSALQANMLVRYLDVELPQ